MDPRTTILIRVPDILRQLSISRSKFYMLLADPESGMPTPIRAGRSVFWRQSEIDAYVLNLVAARDKAAASKKLTSKAMADAALARVEARLKKVGVE